MPTPVVMTTLSLRTWGDSINVDVSAARTADSDEQRRFLDALGANRHAEVWETVDADGVFAVDVKYVPVPPTGALAKLRKISVGMLPTDGIAGLGEVRVCLYDVPGQASAEKRGIVFFVRDGYRFSNDTSAPLVERKIAALSQERPQ